MVEALRLFVGLGQLERHGHQDRSGDIVTLDELEARDRILTFRGYTEVSHLSAAEIESELRLRHVHASYVVCEVDTVLELMVFGFTVSVRDSQSQDLDL